MRHFIMLLPLLGILQALNAQKAFEAESPNGPIDFSAAAPVQQAFLNVDWIQPFVSGLPNARIDNTTGVVAIEVKATSSFPIQQANFTILRNGRPYVPEAKFGNVTFNAQTATFKAQVGLQEGENRIVVSVQNAAGKKETTTLTVSFLPEKPNLYVLTVGSGEGLKYTQNDARDIAALFQAQQNLPNRLFNKIEVKSFVGTQATASTVTSAIENYELMFRTENLSARDVILLSFSTHGAIHNGRFYLQAAGYEPGLYRSTAIDFSTVRDILENIPCKKLILIDACQSGGAKLASPLDINRAIETLNASTGLATFVSSQADQLSYEDAAWQNGAFTEALLNGLGKGEADYNGNKIITLGEITRYVSEKVPGMVKAVKNQTQQPRVNANQLGDLPIYLIP